MLEKDVLIETASGEKVGGKLVSVTDDEIVVVSESGEVQSIAKADATKLSMGKAKAPEGDFKEPEEPKEEAKPEEKPPEDKKKDKGEYKKLGLFTSHGVAYTHWRTKAFSSGAATYALDLGVGYNFSERIGIYGLVGGNVGARLVQKTFVGHQGHFAVAVAVKRKYIAFIPGIGVGFSGLIGDDGSRTRDVGLAIPIRLMGVIPLPKSLFLGIGIGYNLAIVRGGRVVNGIMGQLTIGRW